VNADQQFAKHLRLGDRRLIFDLALARKREAERRLKTLGIFAHEEFDKKRLRIFARDRFVAERELAHWKHEYVLHGFDGLLPQDWIPLTEKAQQRVKQRLAILGELADAITITGDDIYKLSRKYEGDRNFRKAERLVRRYQIDGVWGLAPERDPERMHRPRNQIPPIDDAAATPEKRMDIPLHEVHRQACQRARLLGEPEPSDWQVRYICDRIPEEVKPVADKRFGTLRSERRLTYRFQFDGKVIIYQIDFTQVDVLVRDIRRRGYRGPSEEIRPWLITCTESSSRLVLSWLFTYHVPNSNNIAAVIRDALIVSDEKPYGGIPHAIWVDQGKQLISHHIQRIAQDLKIELKDGKPNRPEDRGDPQERGIEERLFGTIKTRLWSTVLGYVHSNTKERNPNARAEFTITELVEKFRTFVDEYHHKVHSETKKTPLEFWAENCHTVGAEPRELDVLLLVAATRVLAKPSINYGNRRYWLQNKEIPRGTKRLRLVKIRISVCRSKGARNDQYQ
jgi:transposase InsO family protein